MKISMDYLLAQLLSLVFYLITLIVYNRARKEYVGGKIAAAIKLIMVFMAFLLLADFVDYFAVFILPLGDDTILILKIILKLIAICVLFFGGVKFFVSKPAAVAPAQQSALLEAIDAESPQPFGALPEPSAGSTLVLEDIPRSKPTLGRYEILEQIGRGAMGIVYKGRDPKLQRLTAIKTIRFTDEFDESQVEDIKDQFSREAEVVAKLSHPHIVTIYDVGEDLDLSYLAMEYLEGESLEQYTKADNLLSIRKCIDVIIQVCDALEYAHNHGIVHRDIKPANIMLLENGLVKVTDFGIARVAASSKTHTGIIKGTPYYMSPEQAKGLKVTGASDIFSVGVVFYQLLTGRLPFSGDNLAAIMYQTTTIDPDSPTTYNPMINKSVVDILNRCLKKSLSERYQTAKQISEHLQMVIRELDADTVIAAEEETELEDFDSSLATGDIHDETYPAGELEELDELTEADLVSAVPLSEGEQALKDEFDFSVLEQVMESAVETDEVVSLAVQPETQPPDTKDRDQDYDAEGAEAIEISDTEKPDGLSWAAMQDEEEKGPGKLSELAKRIVFYGSLFVFISGLGCYFYWKSTHIEVSIVKKRRNLPVDLNNLKTYVEQQQQKQEGPSKEVKVEVQKQAEQQRLAEIEKQKQAGKERLAEIEKSKHAEQQRLAEIEKQKQAEKQRLAEIEKQKQAEKQRLAEIEKQRREALRRNQLQNIDNLISKAAASFKLKKYLDAKTSYDSALKIIEGSDFKAEEAFFQYKREIEKALQSADIVYGSKGYVKFRDQWLSPVEYENKLYQEGYVKYNLKPAFKII